MKKKNHIFPLIGDAWDGKRATKQQLRNLYHAWLHEEGHHTGSLDNRPTTYRASSAEELHHASQRSYDILQGLLAKTGVGVTLIFDERFANDYRLEVRTKT